MIHSLKEDKAAEKRIQGLNEAMEQRFEKLNKDLRILQSQTGVKKQEASQKNLDQLMSLLNKKMQQYSFNETMIGQNHYKLNQKGMNAPQLEKKLQEQRFLAEKELSNSTNQEKSLFWMDIAFSKEGIDSYLDNNQNYLMFKAIDTMRSQHNKRDAFANRLLAKKSQIRGNLSDQQPFNSNLLKQDQFSRLSLESVGQKEDNLEIYMRSLKQFQLGNISKFSELLSKNSRDFKEVWQLLERILPADMHSLVRRSFKGKGSANGKSIYNNTLLQSAYHSGISFLEWSYRRSAKTKKQNFQRIYDVYNVDCIRSYENENVPLWQELFQYFRAGDYQTLLYRCEQFRNYKEVADFGRDFAVWMENGERKTQQLGTKLKPNWDAFRYQIYLVMLKDPQCVDDVFIEDLDDCLWMNLKCCEVWAKNNNNNNQDDGSAMPLEQVEEEEQQKSILGAETNSRGSFQDGVDQRSFYSSIANGIDDQSSEDLFSWVDWAQLQDLKKMLYNSFKESPEIFNPSRVLMIQLLTLDFLGFAQSLRQLEKTSISQHELVHFLIVLLKSGMVRAFAECAVRKGEEDHAKLTHQCTEFEDFAEKQILLYAKDRFDMYPDSALAYIEALPISRENQLQKFADIIISSNQGIQAIFKANNTQSGVRFSKAFDQQIFNVTNRLKNTNPSDLLLLAKLTAATLIKKSRKVETALEVLDSVQAFEDIGYVLKEQYRIVSQVFETQGMKNQLRNPSEGQKVIESLEKFAEKYFGKRARTVYRDEWKQKQDAHVVQFYRFFRRIKQLFAAGDYDITPTLIEMQEQHYISSSHRETAASEFYDSLRKDHPAQQASYFEFLYLVYLCISKFFEVLKNPNNAASLAARAAQIEKSKRVFKSVLEFSNQFYTKYRTDVDKELEKHLNSAKHAAISASQM